MTTDAPDHTLELMRRMRSETAQGIADLKSAVQNLTAETRITNGHVVALVRHEQYSTEKLADLEVRLARVEKRLDLADPNIPPD